MDTQSKNIFEILKFLDNKIKNVSGKQTLPITILSRIKIKYASTLKLMIKKNPNYGAEILVTNVESWPGRPKTGPLHLWL